LRDLRLEVIVVKSNPTIAILHFKHATVSAVSCFYKVSIRAHILWNTDFLLPDFEEI
jgi:hypothetical protein